MNDLHRLHLPRTNCDLAMLKRGQSHRGAVERIDLANLRGWCLGTADPAGAVTLEILCENLVVGTTRTGDPRPDVSELVGLPLNCGFSFHWLEIHSARRDELIAHIENLGDPDLPTDIVVRVADPEIEVDPAIARQEGMPTRGEFVRQLKTLASRPRRSMIAEREAALKAFPAPTRPKLDTRVRALAFYLPQFHPIPENDQWWGTGFTEWTGVSTAKPQFEGHDQPRIPADLGYYNLQTPGVIEAQIELARSHGLSGFCFHHYWFGGQRLLEKPLERFLDIDHDFGFCLCWANEPWSRRWDGSEQELLMPQPHSLEEDIAFFNDVLPYLKDRRYIRIDDKPVILVYRVGLLSNPVRAFERWRQIAEEHGLPGLYICMAETFGASDPYAHGCDSSVEFPPHKVQAANLASTPGAVAGLNTEFTGNIYDYAQVVAHELCAADPEYPRFKTVMLGWDNTSRRRTQAHVFTHFSPALFDTWLEDACQRTERLRTHQDSRLLFINAWNEWGEGTYLEPDRRYGRTLLESVRRIVQGTGSGEAALEVLRARLQDDAPALAALDRIGEKTRALQRSLAYALEQGRQHPQATMRTLLSTIEPLGLDRMQEGGIANIEQLGPRSGHRRACVRRGETVYCSGWAIPGDRRLYPSSASFLRLSPAGSATQHHYGYIVHRTQREDSAAHAAASRQAALQPPPAAPPRRLDRVLGRVTQTPVVAVMPPSGANDTSKELWNGFSVVFSTDVLQPGRYELALVFPSFESATGTATEVSFEGFLDVIE